MRRAWLQRGDTLVEVVFAIAILASVLTTAYNMSNSSFRVGTNSREHVQAVSFAQQQMETLRWYMDGQMDAGSPILSTTSTGAWPNPILRVCGYDVPCSMNASSAPVAGGPTACGAAAPLGCLFQFEAKDDVINDTLVDNGNPPQKFPEIDEHISLTWPSLTSGSEPCLNGGNNCEQVSFSMRVADRQAYSPIDCSVVGVNCAIAGGGVGVGGALSTLHIASPGDESLSANTAVSFNITSGTPGQQIELYDLAGTAQSSPVAVAAGGIATIPATYPGGTWTVHACYVGTSNCSDNSVTITQLPTRSALYEKYDYNPVTNAGYCLSTGGFIFDFFCGGLGLYNYQTVGQLGWVYGGPQPGTVALYKAFNSNGHYYYTTDPSNLPPGFSIFYWNGYPLFGIVGYIEPAAPNGSCSNPATEPLYRWTQGQPHYYESLSATAPPGWSYDGVIGCVYNAP